MRILIVDDNKDGIYILEASLKAGGYEVVSAGNGAEALEKLRTESVDMIISDVLMPVMDGFKFCKEVREKDELKNIPFIFYTATYKDERDEKLASELGADKYILKPVESKELIKIIQGMLRDVEEGKFEPKKPALAEEKEVFKLYNERLVSKLEKKMLELEREVAWRKEAEKRIELLNLVLGAIRNVNQLIVRERDRDRLIQGACRNFTKNRGFHSAWIAIVDESHRLVTAVEAGLDKAFQPLLKNLKQGNLPYCMRRALAKPGILTIKDPASTCGDCPMANSFKEKGILSSRLEHGGKIYGVLTISFHVEHLSGKQEHPLFEEIVGDIAYALHHIELEEERKQAEEALRQRTHDLGKRVKELSCLYEIDEIIRKEGLTVEAVLEKAVRIIPPSWQYPEITGSCITFENRKYKTKNFKKTKWMQRADIIVNAKKAGLVEVCYLEEKPEDYEGPFLKEERNLMKGVVERLTQFIEHKRAEEALRANEKNLAEAQRIAHMGNWALDLVKNELRWSDEIYRIFGLKPQEFGATYEAFLDAVHPDDREFVDTSYANSVKNNTPYDIVHRIARPDGEVRYVHEKAEDIKDEKGKAIRSIGTVQDITERKRAEEEIRASLKEKEVLLQEVHHRVKNNMQIISSLFSLQSGHIKDKQALEIFKSSQNRVRSMALIHERLYQSKDLTRVNFAEYSQSLTTHLFSSYGINTNVIKFYIDIKDVSLDINTAIPCSLIINEIVSNSLKYAFPGDKKGEIKIAMHTINKNEIELIVSDNGIGLPKKMDFRKTDTLGLHLVNLLAEDQLHGNIKLDRTKGISFHIRFKVKR